MSPWVGPVVAAVTGLATSISLAGTKGFLARRNILDIPNQRSSHTQPTLRGAGLGILVGLLVGLAGGAAILWGQTIDLRRLVLMGSTVTALSAVGFIEDLRGLRVRARMASQVSILILATAALLITGSLPGIMGLLALLGGIFYVNAANFMDGANGISSLHGTIVGGYYALVGAILGSAGMVVSGIALSIAFLSFLPWNVGRSRMFMGDVGSYALGAGAWSLALWAISLGATPIVVCAPLIIYSADVLFTLSKRAARRAPLHQAHHEHTYQRLMPFFRTHTIPTGIATASTAACAVFGLWSLISPESANWPISCALLVTFMYVFCPGTLRAADSMSDKGLVDEHA